MTDLTQEFPPEQSSVADALTFADMTTGPSGEPISVTERLTEILVRYPPGHVVHHAIQEAQPQILATVQRVDTLLTAGQPR